MKVSTLDLDALQAAAEAATPGPWDASRNLDWAFPRTDVITLVGGRQIVRFVDGEPQFWCTTGKAEQEWANAAFIALANPIAILALIDRLRKAEAASKWPPETKAEFALRALVAAGHITQEKVDQALEIAGKFTAHTRAAPTRADSEGENE